MVTRGDQERGKELARERELERERELAEQDREFAEQASEIHTGRTEPNIGPSDSSDAASDMPIDMPDTDSDRHNTGERAQVENTGDGPIADDIVPDKTVPADEAGLARTPPDPERNGG